MSRYLLQIAFACGSPGDAGLAGGPEPVAAIINGLGGRIEHYWRSAGEFDAVLVVQTASHGMAFDVAVAAHPAVKATKTTALRDSDDPYEPYLSWCGPEVMQVIARELAGTTVKLPDPLALDPEQDVETPGGENP